MTMTANGVTEHLVDYVRALEYESLPPAVLDRSKQLFLDFLGVAFGGRTLADSSGPVVQGVTDLLGGQQGPCTVVGDSDRYPAHFAALLNGTFAHSMDFDDTHREAIMHPGAPIFSTLMALGEENGSSGREFLVAAVAAYDVANKLNRAIGGGEGIHKRGFHATATTGIFAATMAGARLMGLSRKQMLNAVGLNISQAAGSQQFLENGAWNKRLHVGLAAHNAIYALAMARRGFKGAAHPLEGRFGYISSYSYDGWDQSKIQGLGIEFEVLKTAIKPYPCCRFNHGAIDGLLALAQRHRLSVSDVSSIDLYFSPLGHEIVGQPEEIKRNPTTVVEGQFSAHFAAAVTLVDGAYSWNSYDKVRDTKVKKLMSVTSVHRSEEVKGLGCRISLTTRDGRSFTEDVPIAKGEPERPLSWDEVTAKFASLAGHSMDESNVQRILHSVRDVEQVEDFGRFTECLRPQT